MTVHCGGKVSAAGDGSPEHKAFIVKKQTAVKAVFRAPSSFYALSDHSLHTAGWSSHLGLTKITTHRHAQKPSSFQDLIKLTIEINHHSNLGCAILLPQKGPVLRLQMNATMPCSLNTSFVRTL